MEMRKFGLTDLMVSQVCLGCMGFGEANSGMHAWTVDYPTSARLIHEAQGLGINFFDTAMSYQNGTSEEFLGRALKENNSREKSVIATKFMPQIHSQLYPELAPKAYIERCLEDSLRRLQTDYIDLYIMHAWDESIAPLELMTILDGLVKSGKVRHIGVSNAFSWQVAQANEIAKAHGLTPFASMQGHYNLIFREEEREMLPYCQKEGMAYTPYSSLASGRLARLTSNSKRAQLDTYAKGKYEATKDQDQTIIQRVVELAEKKNTSLSAITLTWLMQKGTFPIMGVTKNRHLTTLSQLDGISLTPEECQYLEENYHAHDLVGMMKSRM